MKNALRSATGLGLAAVMVSTNATAVDVEIDGIIDVFAGSVEPIGEDTDSTTVLNSGGRDTSYWGIQASDAITSDLTAVGDVEAFFRPDVAESGRFDGDKFFARSAKLGLQGDFGSVYGGRITAPLYLPMLFTNPFGGSFTFSPANFHTYAGNGDAAASYLGDSGWDNSIQYVAPTMGGVTATAQYAFGETEGESGEDRLGGNLVYRSGGTVMIAGAQYLDLGTVGGLNYSAGGEHSSAILGVSQSIGGAQLFGQYQYADYDLDEDLNGNESFDINTGTAGVSLPAGPGSVLAAVAYSDATRLTTDVDFEEGGNRTTFAVGYDMSVGSAVNLYATYFHDDVDEPGLDAGKTLAAGMQYRF
ncbi:porin [Spiribacter aquaticus]|uniref:Porin n=1 Tax=Spiribacter aquaticus TaxID=1935996 RepID=A0A557RMX4_9GAMM|nr:MULTISPECIES: porin [Spiribacter]KAF0279567.1 hypothetical protein BA897_02370 [Spiribacter roseus]TVO66529.1 porin [Spiribacter aquaticus]